MQSVVAQWRAYMGIILGFSGGQVRELAEAAQPAAAPREMVNHENKYVVNGVTRNRGWSPRERMEDENRNGSKSKEHPVLCKKPL